MAPTRHEPFADRVRPLREEKGWSQNELAEHADLAPAALSRILSGDRDPRMEHLIALASALDITLTELVEGTTAARIVQDWIPRARFEDSEKARVDSLRERDIARADAAARTAEVTSLKRTLKTLTGRIEALEGEQVQSRMEVEAARLQRRELSELREQKANLDAECSRLEAQAGELSQAVEESNQQAGQFRQRWEETCMRSQELRSELSKAKGGQFLTGALGVFLGAVLSSDTPPRRSRKG